MAALTEKQKMATDPHSSVRVMANAGAGKTFVLTARVLRLLLNGVHPSKILCLTYTKAAAAEMRERVNGQLEKWVLMDDEALNSDIEKLIEAKPSHEQVQLAKKLFSATLESSPPPRIQTIHSFCQDILKRFPLESGVQPYFEVVDDITSRELIKETTQVLLSKEQVEQEVINAIDYIASEAGEWKFNEVIGEIIQQRNRIRGLFEEAGSPEKLISSIYSKNCCERGVAPARLIQDFWSFSAERKANIEKLAFAMTSSSNENDVTRGQELLHALKERDFNIYSLIFLTKENEPRKNIITKAGRKNFAEPDEVIAFEQNSISEIVDNLIKLENLLFTSHVIHLAAGILGAYDSLKRHRAVIDYNDLIYTTKKLLNSANSAAWVLYKLDGGLEHILIDEAQDTSPEQWQIILALLEEFLAGEGAAQKERTIFIVGDEKQSIYSFQGADQKAFVEVTRLIQEKCRLANKEFNDLSLDTSFRSVDAVLRFADAVFEPEIYRNSVTSEQKVMHLLKRQGEAGRVELWPIIKAEEEEDLENWQLPLNYIAAKSADLLLAEKIAATIADWLENKRLLASQNRPVRASDILILVRSRGELADMLINRLKRNKIAVSGSDRLKITEHISIQDLLALANFLLLPTDDLSLACILKSPLFGISEDDLFKLSYAREKESLWSRLQASTDHQHIVLQLKTLLEKVDYYSVYQLYSLVLDEQGGRKKFISRIGYEVNDILDEFLDLSVNFERSHTNSLQQFISWVSLSNMEIKRDMDSGNEQVRIMTVHGSKGLEAPIVILADATKVPTPKDQLLWDESYFYTNKPRGKYFKGLELIQQEAKKRTYDEYLRLLYVAITRARDELYVAGAVGKRPAKLDESWYKIIERTMMKGLGVKDEISGKYEYISEQTSELPQTKEAAPRQKHQFPAFLKQKAIYEKQAQEIISETEFKDMAAEIDIGNKIHKTLEIIGNIPPDKRYDYLKQTFEDAEMAEKLNQLINNEEFSVIFAPKARAEVPIIGRVKGEIIMGRVDRLVELPDEVWIVDFKTARNIPAKIPKKYRQQLETYREIIAPQYPGKQIKCKILWVSAAKLESLA